MRHIVYIEQFFTFPHEPGITRHYDFAMALAHAGNKVTVITSHQKSQKLTYEGIEIHCIAVSYNNAYGFAKRLWAYTKFAFRAILLTQKLPKIDFAYISSPPLTTGLVALFLKKIKKVPYLLEVRDLWPQFPIEAGGINHKMLKWAAYTFEKNLYQNACKIIACSPGIEAGIRKTLAFQEKPIQMISNFSDTDLFFRRGVGGEKRRKFLAEGERGIVYFGAIGKANQVDYFVELAEISEKKGIKLRFFVVGWGSEQGRLQQKAEKLTNMQFLPPFPKSEMPYFLSLMDFSYTCFQDLPVLRSNSPNKLFDSLAMHLVCFVNMDGWMQEIVEKNLCGAYIPPNQPTVFIEKMEAYLADEGLLFFHQKNARKTAEREFSKKVQVAKMLDFTQIFADESR